MLVLWCVFKRFAVFTVLMWVVPVGLFVGCYVVVVVDFVVTSSCWGV